MIGAKHRYNPIENECLALVFASRRCDTILWVRTFTSSWKSIYWDCLWWNHHR